MIVKKIRKKKGTSHFLKRYRLRCTKVLTRLIYINSVHIDSIQIAKSVSTNVEKRVTLIPKFLITYVKPKSPHDSTKYIGGTILVFSDKSMANVTDAIALR